MVLFSKKKSRLHEGCVPLQLPEDRQILVVDPIRWYPEWQVNDTVSPVQCREPSLCPFDGEPGSPQVTRALKITDGMIKHIKRPRKKTINILLGDI